MRFLAEDILSVGLLFFFFGGGGGGGVGKGEIGKFCWENIRPWRGQASRSLFVPRKRALCCPLVEDMQHRRCISWKAESVFPVFSLTLCRSKINNSNNLYVLHALQSFKTKKKSCINWAFRISGEDTFWHFWSLYCLKVEWLHWGQRLAGPMFI